MKRQPKKRDKAYNPHKSFRIAIQRAEFVSFESETENGDRTCATNIASPALRDAVIHTRQDWLVIVGVICRDESGSLYVEEREMVGRGCLVNELTDAYQAEKADAYESVNPKHVIDRGWVIRPYTKQAERQLEHGTYKGLLDTWQERQRRFAKRLEAVA